MSKKQEKWLCSTSLATALLLCSLGTASAAVDKVITVPWQGDPAKQHTALSGVAAQHKGVIKTTNVSAVYYKWVFGDNTESAVTALSGSTKYNVAADHTYSGASGTPITAKLQVSDTNPFSLAKEGSYFLKIEDGTQDAHINISIDKGLWWLYNQANNLGGYAAYPHTYDGSPYMAWLQTGYVYTLAAPTASAVHAFGINGHKIKGNPDLDPYVEAVQLGMNYLTKGYNYYTTYPALTATSIAGSLHGNGDDPDANHNGYGIYVYDFGNDHSPYQSGQIMNAIVASGVDKADFTGRDFSRNDAVVVKNWTYGELLQDMADMHAYGQSEAGGCNGGICGSWWYGWNYGGPGDNSASQWAAIGMIPAEKEWGTIIPRWVRDYNENWLAYSMGCSGPSKAVTACSYNFFSYNGVGGYAGDNAQQTTTSGMVQMAFDGQTTSDLKWQKGQKKIADEWRSFLHDGSTWGGYRTYGWYSFAKAMHESLPLATTKITKTSGATFDWYYGNPGNAACSSEANCEKGLAQHILEIQATDGHWDGNMSNSPLTTAWMIITLKPTLFQSSPIPCFSATPNPNYANADTFFDPACSNHSEPGKNLGSLKLFEWDFDNSGTYQVSTTLPTAVTHQFPALGAYPIKLRVTDDSNPPRTATTTATMNITIPPHPPVPVASAGGPYLLSLCSQDSLTLDGSGSYSPDAGQSQPGAPATAKLVKWDWDLVNPFNFTPVDVIATTEKTTLSHAQYMSYFSTAGTFDIGLRVTDNAYDAFPSAVPRQNLVGSAFGKVTVTDGCICTIAAVPAPGKVQLNWSSPFTAGVTYNVLRSTAGPNKGFATIKSGYSAAYPNYVDSGLANSTTYYYRVDRVKDGVTCESRVVQVTTPAAARR